MGVPCKASFYANVQSYDNYLITICFSDFDVMRKFVVGGVGVVDEDYVNGVVVHVLYKLTQALVVVFWH